MFLKSSEMARLLGVSKNTLHKWVYAGKVPVAFTLPSGHMRFDKLEVRKALGVATVEEMKDAEGKDNG